MGYCTQFGGRFNLDKPLDNVTFNFLIKFNKTRRMARRVDVKYGVEGEFYVDGSGAFGQGREENIIDFNKNPRTQPGLWCNWKPSEDHMHIEWDGGEKFYYFIEWIEYLISKILAPRGYVVNGSISWQGEELHDTGVLEVNDNMVMGKRLIRDYSINRLLGAVETANPTPSVSMNKRNFGIRPDGSKTKHQKSKERQEAAMQILKDQIADLEKQLKEKDEQLAKGKVEEKKINKLTIQDLMLEKIRKQSGFGSDLQDFKVMLKNLLGE